MVSSRGFPATRFQRSARAGDQVAEDLRPRASRRKCHGPSPSRARNGSTWRLVGLAVAFALTLLYGRSMVSFFGSEPMLCMLRVTDSVPFLWDEPLPEWGRLTTAIPNVTGETRGRVDVWNDNPLLHPALASLGHKSFKDKPEPHLVFTSAGRAFTFENVVVNGQGWIAKVEEGAGDDGDGSRERVCCLGQEEGSCLPTRIVRNGGCRRLPLDDRLFNVPTKGGSKTYHQTVVTLAQRYGYELGHFAMEAIMGVGEIEKILDQEGSSRSEFPIADREDYLIHVTQISGFNLQWLDLVGVSKNRVVTGTIHAANALVVPEMGKCCNALPHQVRWLSGKVREKLEVLPEQASVVLIERTKDKKVRQIHNGDVVKELVTAFAARNGLDLVIFSDANKFPPLLEQLRTFAGAKVVVGPHGAGLSNLMGCQPGTTVVEFMDILYQNSPINIDLSNVVSGFARVSGLLGLRHIGIPINQNMVDTKSLEALLDAFPGGYSDFQWPQ